MDLAKKGELSIGVVRVKEEPINYSDDYSYKEPIQNI